MAPPLVGRDTSAAELFQLDKPRRRRRRRQPVGVTRPCVDCGATTTSYSRFYCAACHFRGWWGEWA
jgi:hypothetical protein